MRVLQSEPEPGEVNKMYCIYENSVQVLATGKIASAKARIAARHIAGALGAVSGTQVVM